MQNPCSIRWRGAGMAWTFVVLVTMTVRSALAVNFNWDAGGGVDQDWSNATNWINDAESLAGAGDVTAIGHPTSGVNPAYAVITQPGEAALTLRVGYNANTKGCITILGGDLACTSLYLAYGSNAVGIVTQAAGQASVSGAVMMGANHKLSSGSYYMTGGLLSCGGNFTLGSEGYGEFTQLGGTNSIGDAGTDSHTFGNAAGTGLYTLGPDAILQANGSVTLGKSSSTNGGNGSLMVNGGTWRIAASSSLVVRGDDYSRGRVQGWGRIAIDAGTGFLKMNGLMIADGGGVDRALALVYNRRNQPTLANGATGTNGWYAVNRGKLVLDGVTVTGNGTSYWGAYQTTPVFDLVNAASISLTGVSGSGSVTGALYAADRADVPARHPSSKIIGIWRFEKFGFTSSMTVTCRYDHVAAAARGIVESDLRLFKHDGGEGDSWTPLSTTVDTGNRWLSASEIDGTPFLAAGKDITSVAGARPGSVIEIR